MIDKALMFLRDALNAHLAAPVPGMPASAEDAVVFLDGDKSDPVSFRMGAVTALLINVEQEPHLRAANPWQRVGADGSVYQAQPDIRLNLHVMFVARFTQYEQALGQLSRILTFFQANPVLDARGAPGMPAEIPRLSLELLTLPLAEQNDLWNALRAAFQPSLLYRVRMVVFGDTQPAVLGPVTGEPERHLADASRAALRAADHPPVLRRPPVRRPRDRAQGGHRNPDAAAPPDPEDASRSPQRVRGTGQ